MMGTVKEKLRRYHLVSTCMPCCHQRFMQSVRHGNLQPNSATPWICSGKYSEYHAMTMWHDASNEKLMQRSGMQSLSKMM